MMIRGLRAVQEALAQPDDVYVGNTIGCHISLYREPTLDRLGDLSAGRYLIRLNNGDEVSTPRIRYHLYVKP